MATMKQVTETEASGTVRKIYDEMIAHWGNVPNAYKVLANNPHVLKAAWENRKDVMGHATLDPKVTEFLAWATVVLNNCKFGIETHTARLKKMGYTNADILEALSVIQFFVGISTVINGLAMVQDTNPEVLDILSA
ncbi:MAG: carboxymuconolactone decarboxylase family protein [candidate division NC10 bacterium]|nr:carboxymuconolactone decarboxylase family protein [candidate division NC10 bacterium]